MKTIGNIFLLAGCIIVQACGEPEQKFRVAVADENGKPMPGIESKAWFHHRGKNSPLATYSVTGATGPDGVVELMGETVRYQTGVEIEHNGYYPSGIYKHWITNRSAGHWEPWPVKVKLVLKKIRNPHPMYAVKPGDGMKFEFPAGLAGPVGFDLMARDWVFPHGKGKIADFVLEARKLDPESKDHFPPGILTITFTNPKDGIIPMPDQAAGGSLLASPHEAPEKEYANRLQFSNRPLGDKSFPGLELRQRVWVFRVRSKLDESGNLLSAHYGKIQGHPEILFFRRGPAFRMTYYLNGKPNERNLEWDMKNNLFKDLPEEHWPRRP